ncbi:hypothetical protein DAI22_02g151200 [Oryza sativa Japonica Group]|nr:hypothetical protein DAI22_02g151200 [Oryza sativa Japonica Group]
MSKIENQIYTILKTKVQNKHYCSLRFSEQSTEVSELICIYRQYIRSSISEHMV